MAIEDDAEAGAADAATAQEPVANVGGLVKSIKAQMPGKGGGSGGGGGHNANFSQGISDLMGGGGGEAGGAAAGGEAGGAASAISELGPLLAL